MSLETYEIRSYQGVGPIELNESGSELIRRIGPPIEIFKAGGDSKLNSYAYLHLGFMIEMSIDEKVNFIEVNRKKLLESGDEVPIQLTYQGVQLFHRPVSEILKDFEGLGIIGVRDNELKYLINFPDLGFIFYTTFDEMNNEVNETVSVYNPNYYSEFE